MKEVTVVPEIVTGEPATVRPYAVVRPYSDPEVTVAVLALIVPVWIAADAFVGPNVSIGNSSIIAARAVVIKNVEENNIVGGNPAKFIKTRNLLLECW